MEFLRPTALALCVLGGFTSLSATPVTTVAGHITYMASGWHDPTLRVQLDIPAINPDSCAIADGYMVSATSAGNELFNSILLMAFAPNRRVTVTLDGCAVSRPQIIGVDIVP